MSRFQYPRRDLSSDDGVSPPEPHRGGVSAVRLFREQHQDLLGVLLDLKMPRMDGATAFRQMRDIDGDVPVVICSGHGDNEEVQGLLALGARALLPKPFRIDELSRLVGRLRAQDPPAWSACYRYR